MNINVDPQQNTDLIYKIECGPDSLVLHTDTRSISFSYEQVTLQIKITVGRKKEDPLEALQDTFTSPSMEGTFHSFRTFRKQSQDVSVSSMTFSFSAHEKRYSVTVEELLDILFDMLKERHPFASISYVIQKENPDDVSEVSYGQKIDEQLREILLPPSSEQTAPVVTKTVPRTFSYKKYIVPVFVFVIIAIAIIAVYWIVRG